MMCYCYTKGMSSSGLAVSEKHSDVPLGRESRSGIPFNFLMRDILQFDTSLQDAIRSVKILKPHNLFVAILLIIVSILSSNNKISY